MLNLIYTLPRAFFPAAGGQLVLRGISEAEAVEQLKQEGFRPYIRSFPCCQVLTGRIGVKIRTTKKRCPLPTPDSPTLIAAPLFQRLLDPQEVLSEEEILGTPIKWMLAELIQDSSTHSPSEVPPPAPQEESDPSLPQAESDPLAPQATDSQGG
ncbi:hypothetical protein GFS31_44260 (plasmid) [Leptolyngbya sp. BL0902]|uniref:hypothetical protein n=1 Tax=Leptolyngbya sp. BL0902 TaxID=1115757 RepID=UPI0018E89511|nr:hypothetical protein [Leptolyngbya sp. BL0902]QQE67713.1 hypothetical protein GFS31_44260 [Leptolyngbya sp. BL0902]